MLLATYSDVTDKGSIDYRTYIHDGMLRLHELLRVEQTPQTARVTHVDTLNLKQSEASGDLDDLSDPLANRQLMGFVSLLMAVWPYWELYDLLQHAHPVETDFDEVVSNDAGVYFLDLTEQRLESALYWLNVAIAQENLIAGQTVIKPLHEKILKSKAQFISALEKLLADPSPATPKACMENTTSNSDGIVPLAVCMFRFNNLFANNFLKFAIRQQLVRSSDSLVVYDYYLNTSAHGDALRTLVGLPVVLAEVEGKTGDIAPSWYFGSGSLQIPLPSALEVHEGSMRYGTDMRAAFHESNRAWRTD